MGAKNLEKPMENQQFYKSADAESDLAPEPFPSPNPSPSLLNIISFSQDETFRAASYLKALRQALPVIRQPLQGKQA